MTRGCAVPQGKYVMFPIATSLVKRRAAACVNIVPRIESAFWWKARVERCRETLLIVKTTAGGFERLRRAVIELHPYEVPEVIAWPLAVGHAPYLRWVVSAVSRKNG